MYFVVATSHTVFSVVYFMPCSVLKACVLNCFEYNIEAGNISREEFNVC